jgi:hypothetical protein
VFGGKEQKMTNIEQISGFSMDMFSLKGRTAIVTGAN